MTATVLATSTCLALVLSGACEPNPDASTTAQTPQTPQTAQTPQTPQAPQAPATAEVQEIKDSPHQFYGKSLTLSGEIEKIRGDRAFVLEGDGSWFQDEILVVTRSPVAFGARRLSEDDDVLVTGKVQQMVAAEIEREMGWDLSTELETEFRDKPVVMAQSVQTIEQTAFWSESEQPKGAIVSIVAIDLIGPDDLVGQTIRLDSIPVQAKTGKGLWVGHRHRNMLLVGAPEGTDLANIQVGDVVSVQGELQKMPPADDAMKRWSIDDPSMRGQVEQEPLYIDANKVSKLDARAPRGQAAPAG